MGGADGRLVFKCAGAALPRSHRPRTSSRGEGRSRGLWVCLGVKPWHGDTLQSSAANVVNVNTKNEKPEREGCFPARLGLNELIQHMAASERAFITGKKKKINGHLRLLV